MDKYELSFSQNVSEERKNHVQDWTLLKAIESNSKYLGIPTFVER